MESFKIMLIRDTYNNISDINVMSGTVDNGPESFNALVIKDNKNRVSVIEVVDDDGDLDGPETFRISIIRDAKDNVAGFEIIDDDADSDSEDTADSDSMAQGETFVKNKLKHHGVLGMKWGHGGGSSGSTSSTVSRRQQKKITKGDAKFEKHANSYSNKVELHNSIHEGMNKFLDAHNAKYARHISNGGLLNEDSPTTKKYNAEVSKEYVRQMNVTAKKMSNTSGTKTYHVVRNNNDHLGFSVITKDKSAKHSADLSNMIPDAIDESSMSNIMVIKFIRDKSGIITGLELVDPEKDTLVQGEKFVKSHLKG